MDKDKQITKQNSKTKTYRTADNHPGDAKSKITHVSHITIATSVTLGAVGAVCLALGTHTGILFLIILGIIFPIAGGLMYFIAAKNAEDNELNSPIFPISETGNRSPINFIPDAALRNDVRTIKKHVENITKAQDAKEEVVISESPLEKENTLQVSPNNELVLSDGRLLVNVTPEYLTYLGDSDDLTQIQIERMWDSFEGKWIMFNGTLNNAKSLAPDLLFVTIDREPQDNPANRIRWPFEHVTFSDPLQIETVHAIKKHDPIRVVCKIARKSMGRGVDFNDCEILK